MLCDARLLLSLNDFDKRELPARADGPGKLENKVLSYDFGTARAQFFSLLPPPNKKKPLCCVVCLFLILFVLMFFVCSFCSFVWVLCFFLLCC